MVAGGYRKLAGSNGIGSHLGYAVSAYSPDGSHIVSIDEID
jgi:hypothetical protein